MIKNEAFDGKCKKKTTTNLHEEIINKIKLIFHIQFFFRQSITPRLLSCADVKDRLYLQPNIFKLFSLFCSQFGLRFFRHHWLPGKWVFLNCCSPLLLQNQVNLFQTFISRTNLNLGRGKSPTLLGTGVGAIQFGGIFLSRGGNPLRPDERKFVYLQQLRSKVAHEINLKCRYIYGNKIPFKEPSKSRQCNCNQQPFLQFSFPWCITDVTHKYI